MNDYCITTLSCGAKYREHLKENILTNQGILASRVKFFIVTDEPDYFKDLDYRFVVHKIHPVYYTDIHPDKTKNWFNYHLKRFAIKAAVNNGYSKILYIDSDIRVLEWNRDFLIKQKKGFYFRRTFGRDLYPEKHQYYSEKYRVDLWNYYRPVSEKLIFINEDIEKINSFINVWDYLDKNSIGEINPYSEGYEIAISCRFNNIQVHKYDPDPFKGDNSTLKDLHIRNY